MQKIDFFGGLHGNYLELIINVTINQNGYDISRPQFTPDGACHLKNQDRHYDRMIVARHYSFNKIAFGQDDQVVRIVPAADDMLIGITNSFLRAGDENIDLDCLEKNTLTKLSKVTKGTNFKNTLVTNYGEKVDYNRAAIRNYFYSMLNDYENGTELYSAFDSAVSNVYCFPFRAFFDIGHFYQELNAISKFLGLNFYPTTKLGKLHKDFLSFNQGHASEMKCKQIWQAILLGESLDIKLNLIEEAWINYMVAKCLRCYDLPLLVQDQYPTNTLDISQAVFAWKSKDFLT